MNLDEYLSSASKDLFGFEFLQEFNIPEEEDDFKIWQRTRKVDLGGMKDWLKFIELKTKQGVKMRRVRLVKFPLTEYIKFELDTFKETVNLGEEIGIITENKFLDLSIDLSDFWLIDGKKALKMEYAKTGEFIGFEAEEGKRKHQEAKEMLLLNSIPLDNFLKSLLGNKK